MHLILSINDDGIDAFPGRGRGGSRRGSWDRSGPTLSCPSSLTTEEPCLLLTTSPLWPPWRHLSLTTPHSLSLLHPDQRSWPVCHGLLYLLLLVPPTLLVTRNVLVTSCLNKQTSLVSVITSIQHACRHGYSDQGAASTAAAANHREARPAVHHYQQGGADVQWQSVSRSLEERCPREGRKTAAASHRGSAGQGNPGAAGTFVHNSGRSDLKSEIMF